MTDLIVVICWFITTLLLCGTNIYLQFKVIDLESAIKKLSEVLKDETKRNSKIDE